MSLYCFYAFTEMIDIANLPGDQEAELHQQALERDLNKAIGFRRVLTIADLDGSPVENDLEAVESPVQPAQQAVGAEKLLNADPSIGCHTCCMPAGCPWPDVLYPDCGQYVAMDLGRYGGS